MKLLIEQSDAYDGGDAEITIRCGMADERLEGIIAYIRLQMFSVSGTKDGETRVLPLGEIYYFESIDERTFAYLQSDVYECALKLYELEEQLQQAHFVRISKSCIVNIMKLITICISSAIG